MRSSYNTMSGGSRFSHQQSTVDTASARAKEAAEEAARKSKKPFKFCSRRFGFVLISAGMLAFQDMTFNISVTKARKRIFTDEFMQV
jgi:hypothetical protein